MKSALTILALAVTGFAGQAYATAAPVSIESNQPSARAAASIEAPLQVAPSCPDGCGRPIVDEEEEFTAAPIEAPFQVAPNCGNGCPLSEEEEEFSAAPIRSPFQVAPCQTGCWDVDEEISAAPIEAPLQVAPGCPIGCYDMDEEEFSAAPIQEPFQVAPNCPPCRPIDVDEEDIV